MGARTHSARFIRPAEALERVELGATVLDARGTTAYLAGHIPGAVRADWRAATVGGLLSGTLGPPERVAAHYGALGVDDARPVLTVGAWTAGWGEEARVAWDLVWIGHTDVCIVQGGMDAWKGPRVYLPSRPRPGRLTARPRGEVRTTTAELSAAVAGGRAPFVIDVRTPEEYAGARKYGEARGGHVPGAVNIAWQSLVALPPDIPDRTTPIVVYCTAGVRSSMAWAALRHHGYTEVTNDDGSWLEWARLTTE